MASRPSKFDRDVIKWLEPKGYLHFDRRHSKKFVRDYCATPELVAKHQFWPLIEYGKETKRYRDGKTRPKVRPIRYASHLDAAVFGFYGEQLTQAYEAHLRATSFEPSVLAYRRLGKTNADFAAQAFASIRDLAPCHVLALDLREFFESLDHQRIKSMWRRMLGAASLPDDHYAVFRAATSWCVVDQERVRSAFGISRGDRRRHRDRICAPAEFRTVLRDQGALRRNARRVGIPQGLPLSAVLSNMYMLDVDSAIYAAVSDVRGRYWRYSDDILIAIPHSASQLELLGAVQDSLRTAGLSMQEEKTDEVDFLRSASGVDATRPLQYLGFLY